MKKKYIVRLVIVFICILLTGIYVYKVERGRDTSSIEERENNRINNLDEVINNAKLDNPPNEEDILNGNYAAKDIVLVNRKEFISKFEDVNIGTMISNNIIPDFVDYLKIILEDCTYSNLEQYYKVNKEAVDVILGTSSQEEFKEIFSIIYDIGNIKLINIDLDSLLINSNVVRFDLNLVNDNEQFVKLDIVAVISDYKNWIVNFYIGD